MKKAPGTLVEQQRTTLINLCFHAVIVTNILMYPMILKLNSENLDQSVWMSWLTMWPAMSAYLENLFSYD